MASTANTQTLIPMPLNRLAVTTLGWQHEKWQEAFYPADLPEDWQLDYFLNVFSLAVVPQSVWLAWLQPDNLDLDEARLDEIFASLNAQNGLIFVADESQVAILESALYALAQTKHPIKNQLIAVVILAEQLRPSLELCGLPVCLVSKQLQFSGWSWQQGEWYCSGFPLAWLSQLPGNDRLLSQQIKQFAQSVPNGNGILCVVDPEAPINRVQNMKTLCELLGY
ncbi:MAG: hypothetical protein JXR44_06430 [Thiotrichales bacterium]|nr:hypothetical protein [Thiotrichales bacterium]